MSRRPQNLGVAKVRVWRIHNPIGDAHAASAGLRTARAMSEMPNRPRAPFDCCARGDQSGVGPAPVCHGAQGSAVDRLHAIFTTFWKDEENLEPLFEFWANLDGKVSPLQCTACRTTASISPRPALVPSTAFRPPVDAPVATLAGLIARWRRISSSSAGRPWRYQRGDRPGGSPIA